MEDTAQAIEAGRFGEIDRVALADEVRYLGKSERNRLESAFRVLLIHLLTGKYQPDRESPSWQASIKLRRKQTAEYLFESPSLRLSCPVHLKTSMTTLALKRPTKLAWKSTHFQRFANGQLVKSLITRSADKKAAFTK